MSNMLRRIRREMRASLNDPFTMLRQRGVWSFVNSGRGRRHSFPGKVGKKVGRRMRVWDRDGQERPRRKKVSA